LETKLERGLPNITDHESPQDGNIEQDSLSCGGNCRSVRALNGGPLLG